MHLQETCSALPCMCVLCTRMPVCTHAFPYVGVLTKVPSDQVTPFPSRLINARSSCGLRSCPVWFCFLLHPAASFMVPFPVPPAPPLPASWLFRNFAWNTLLPFCSIYADSGMPAQRRRPLLRSAWLPGMDQVVLFSCGSVGFLPSLCSLLITAHL